MVFEYKPLGPSQIRLLHIDSVDDNVVRCSLKQPVALGDIGKYFALSYCWGSDVASQEIELDGHCFPVTPNLLAALKAVHRYMDQQRVGDRFLWADGICIDQQNDADKREQIPLMRQIYSHPEQVLVWLGDDKDESAKVMKALEWIEQHRICGQYLLDDAYVMRSPNEKSKFGRIPPTGLPDKLEEPYKMNELTCESCITVNEKTEVLDGAGKSLSRSRLRTLTGELKELYGIDERQLIALDTVFSKLSKQSLTLSRAERAAETKELLARESVKANLFPPEHPFWISMLMLLRRDWFKRVWTYQEIMLSEKATVLCGFSYVAWDIFLEPRSDIFFGGFQSYLSGAKPVRCAKSVRSLYTEANFVSLCYKYIRGVRHSTDILQFRYLLICGRHRVTAKPQDFIYGLLGLVDDDIRSNIPINYDLEPSFIFSRAAMLACQGATGASYFTMMLQYCDGVEKKTPGLPSWCPDFGGKTNEHTTDIREDSIHMQRDMCSDLADVDYEEDPGVVRVLGLELEMVQKAASVAVVLPVEDETVFQKPAQEELAIYLESGWQWLQEMRKLLLPDVVDGSLLVKWVKEIILLYTLELDSSPSASEKSALLVDTFLKICSGVESLADCEASFSASMGVPMTVARKMYLEVFSRARGRYFFVTDRNKIGFARRPLHSGDQICFFPGMNGSLYVLSPDRSKYIGCAWIEGMMDDEALLDYRDRWHKEKRVFRLH